MQANEASAGEEHHIGLGTAPFSVGNEVALVGKPLTTHIVRAVKPIKNGKVEGWAIRVETGAYMWAEAFRLVPPS